MTDETLEFRPVKTLTVHLERAEQTDDNGIVHEHHRAIVKSENAGVEDVVRSAPTAEEALAQAGSLIHTL